MLHLTSTKILCDLAICSTRSWIFLCMYEWLLANMNEWAAASEEDLKVSVFKA